MAERLQFRRRGGEARHVGQPRIRVMAALFVVCAAMLAARTWLIGDPPPPPPVVEVRGEVPRPGFYEAATLHHALAAAGVEVVGQVDATLAEGTAVIVDADGGVKLARMDDLLVFGLPIDVNTASAAALEAIPGVGAKTAAAILSDREENGAFASVEDLDRVRGIGPATVERLRPFVRVE